MTPKYIIIHCSDSPQGRGDNAHSIHRWHLDRGWSGIGYHAVFLEDGSIEYGRPDYWEGAHARGYNNKSLGGVMIGINSFTENQLEAALNWTRNKMQQYNILKENVLGHYETELSGGKSCPNYPMDDFREAL